MCKISTISFHFIITYDAKILILIIRYVNIIVGIYEKLKIRDTSIF